MRKSMFAEWITLRSQCALKRELYCGNDAHNQALHQTQLSIACVLVDPEGILHQRLTH